jgi:hypothetical protein
VSAGARVWVFDAGSYVVADSGNNGVQCYVGRSWPLALEPQCFDEEGARTILPIEMYRCELLHRGIPSDSVERAIAAGLASGRFRLPLRPAMTWMLSSAQVLYSDAGRRVGAWKPHVMIYYPYLTADNVGTGSNEDLAAGIVVSPNSPLSSIIVVVPGALDPAPVPEPAGSRRR